MTGNKKEVFFVETLLMLVFSTLTLFSVATAPSSISERVFWIYSTEKILFISFFLITFLISLFFFIFHRMKFIDPFLNWWLSSKFVHAFSVLMLIVSVVFFVGSFQGAFGKYTSFSYHLYPLFVYFLLVFSNIIILQLIYTKEEVGGRIWQVLSRLQLNKEDKLILLSVLVLAGFFLAVVVNYYRGVYMDMPYPYNTFLFEIDDRFSDFYVVLDEIRDMNPYLMHTSGQYPFLLLVVAVFSHIKGELSYFLFILLFSSFYFSFSYYFLRVEKISSSVLYTLAISTCTYPFLFSLDRGNFEMLVFIFLLFFLYFYQKKNFALSAIFLGLASAMKIFPAIFLLLYLKDRKIKEGILAFLTMIGLTVISLSVFTNGFLKNLHYLMNFSNIKNNLVFSDFLSLAPGSWVQRGVTLYTFVKIIIHQLRIPVSPFIANNFPNIYLIIVAVLFIPVALYVLFVEKELWKNVTLLTVSMLIFPTLSGDYKLLHMYLPLFLFINSKEHNRLDLFYLVSFAILLIPKNYFFLKNVTSDASECHDISLAVTTNFTILFSFLISIMGSGWMGRKKRISSTEVVQAG